MSPESHPPRRHSYRHLEAAKIVTTTASLAFRIHERFPDSSLGALAAEPTTTAQEARARCREIRKPNMPLRITSVTLLLTILAAMVALFSRVETTEGMWKIENFLEELNAILGSIVLLGGGAFFLMTLDSRLKRHKALVAVNELRALAHIVDMHQLTKDPEPILLQGPRTAHSPTRTMTPFELSRYFDYCSELLSLISKVGALYIQAFPDPVVFSAVDDLETLCTGLSRKIWQKIMILDRFAERAEAGSEEDSAVAPPPEPEPGPR